MVTPGLKLVTCRGCGTAMTIMLAENAPIARANCPSCSTPNFVSHYVRIDIGLSEVCNLACNMCRRPQESEFMAPERVALLLQEARSIGVETISFSGGEPFVHPQFRGFVEQALGLGFSVEVVTNGTLLKPGDIAICERLKCITVSIDGSEETHDYIRGKKGAWRRTMESLALLAASRAKWGTNTVIQARNAGDLEAIWTAIRAVGRPSYMAFTHVEVVPETAHLLPGPVQSLDIKRQISLIQQACKRDGIHFNDEALVTRMFDIFSDKRRRYRPLGGCTIPRTFLGISQYGIFPCWHQGRAIPSSSLIEGLESALCRDIVAEAAERRCIGCNAANYSWSDSWVEGIYAAAAQEEWEDGVVYLSKKERVSGSLSEGRRTLPILERMRRD